MVLSCGTWPGCRLPLHHSAHSAGGGGAGISFSMQATAGDQREVKCLAGGLANVHAVQHSLCNTACAILLSKASREWTTPAL